MAVNSVTFTTQHIQIGDALREAFFSREDLIGLQLLPAFDVDKQKGVFPTVKKAQSLIHEDVSRSPRGAYPGGDLKTGEVEFECVERGYEVNMDHSELAFYRSLFDAGMAAGEEGMWKVMLDHEVTVKNLLINETTFTTGNGKRTDVSTAWSNAAATIISDVLTGKEAIRGRTGAVSGMLGGKYVLWIGAVDLRYLLTNTDIRDALRYVMSLGINSVREALASVLGVDEVVIGKGVTNTAGEDASETFTAGDIWSTGWSGLVFVPGGSLRGPGYGRTMIWTADSPGGVIVESYEKPTHRSTCYRSRLNSDELEIDSDYAQLFDTAG